MRKQEEEEMYKRMQRSKKFKKERAEVGKRKICTHMSVGGHRRTFGAFVARQRPRRPWFRHRRRVICGNLKFKVLNSSRWVQNFGIQNDWNVNFLLFRILEFFSQLWNLLQISAKTLQHFLSLNKWKAFSSSFFQKISPNLRLIFSTLLMMPARCSGETFTDR